MALATISKRFDFSAAHQLEGLHPSHPCSRMHGHNYEVLVELTGHTDDTGFVIDYRRLAPFKTFLDDTVEHRTLNDLMDENPTAENIAGWLLDVVHDLLWETAPDGMRRVTRLALSVSETPKTNCTVERAPDPFEAEEREQGRDQQVTPFLIDADRYRWNFDHDGSEATPARDEADQAATDAAHRLLQRARNYLADEEGR